MLSPIRPNKRAKKRVPPYISRIKEILLGAVVPFFRLGAFMAPQAPSLRLKSSGETFQAIPAENFASQETALQKLLACMEPAPFGHGRETKFDTAVRNALQLKAECFSVEGFDPQTSGLLDRIKAELLPHSSAPLVAELYALNAYVKDGHFKAHKDTLRGENMIGTLVVALPTLFSGGEFVLHHRHLKAQTKWSHTLGAPMLLKPNTLRWIAFFGDVDHSVLPVTAGVRLTISYTLRQTAEPSSSAVAASNTTNIVSSDSLSATAPPAPLTPAVPTQESALVQCLQAAVADPNFFPGGCSLVFPCHHMYGQQELFGNSDSLLLSASEVSKLKGRDALVANAALQAGLEIVLQPYLTESCADTRWLLEQLPNEKTVRKLSGKRVDQDKLSELLGAEEIESWCSPRPEEEVWIEDPPRGGQASAAKHAKAPAISHLLRCNYSPDGYFGNEGGETDFYVYVALSVEIPALGDSPNRPAPPSATPAPASAPSEPDSATSAPPAAPSAT